MSFRMVRLVLGVNACLLSTATPATAPELAWMEGCWETKSGTREVWVGGADTMIFGFNVVIRDGNVRFFEQLRLELSDGAWSFVASPRGRAFVPFEESDRATEAITFTNQDHDFPQKISYSREGDSLVAEVSLIDGSNLQRWIYNPCSTE